MFKYEGCEELPRRPAGVHMVLLPASLTGYFMKAAVISYYDEFQLFHL